MAEIKKNFKRIDALDFTKGALVLIMVLYHWLNYFEGPQGNIYRYLRFLTPSFIFISGFLISNIYFSKYKNSAGSEIPKRLLLRGFKILAVFTFLNCFIGLILSQSYNGQILFGHYSLQNLVAVYIIGNVFIAGQGKAAAFYILVPISYVLIFSAGLVVVSRFVKYIFYYVCGILMASVFLLKWYGIESGNLELLAIGMMGVVCGYVPIEKINRWVSHPITLIIGYALYVAAITFWNVIFILQILGVCLSLMLLYWIGLQGKEPGSIKKCTILLGKYSLWGYIAQIAILQILYRGLRHVNHNAIVLVLTFVAALLLTVMSVEIVDRARTRAGAVDRLYKAVFA
jgi:peptidoglycan/LPS O-acetylase OafA/YrhL